MKRKYWILRDAGGYSMYSRELRKIDRDWWCTKGIVAENINETMFRKIFGLKTRDLKKGHCAQFEVEINVRKVGK